MALNPRLRRYLEHFGLTVPVAEFVRRTDDKNLVALRHDIDYDIDVALETAFWEQKLGHRASYFILHTAGYWTDPRLLDKCLQIQDFGHEVGLHTNLIAQWYKGEIDDVGGALAALLDRFRSAGLDVAGVAAHGDALCYEAGFANYWLFEELRPADPVSTEARVTAEGSRAHGSDRSISYPASSHRLTRPDGAALDYWSLRLADFGLRYEGSRVPADSYFSDSGADWKRSPDPLTADLTNGRHLVLMHPIHWKDRQRHYYFLSTARSGSNWLANFLDSATSVTARHEFTLNHTFKADKLVAEKRTGAAFSELRASTAEVDRLIAEARTWSEGLNRDYAEANIYLEQFIDRLPHDEDTLYVHLHRHPAAVVRSLLQRGWYAIPYDHNHPQVGLTGWHQLSQLEQACWYVRDVNERLAAGCTSTLAFENMTRDLDYLAQRLAALGIAVYPRLAQPIFNRPLNSTAEWDVRPVSAWPEHDRQTFLRICGPVMERLGYADRKRALLTDPNPLLRVARAIAARFDWTDAKKSPAPSLTVEQMSNLDTIGLAGAASVKNCTLLRNGTRLGIRFPARESSYLLFGGGFFHGAKEAPGVSVENGTGTPPLGGWTLAPGMLYTVGLSLEFADGDSSLRLLCLSYDKDGRPIDQREIGVVGPAMRALSHHFRPSRRAKSFNLALFKGREQDELEVRIKQFQLVAHAERRSAAISPQETLKRASTPVNGMRSTCLIKDIAELAATLESLAATPIAPWHAAFRVENGTLLITPSDADRHGNFLAGGGAWNHAHAAPTSAFGAGPTCAWKFGAGERLRAYVRGKPLRAADNFAVCVLSYDARGELIQNMRVGAISERQESVSFSHALPTGTSYCNLGFSLPVGSAGLALSQIEVVASSTPSAPARWRD